MTPVNRPWCAPVKRRPSTTSSARTPATATATSAASDAAWTAAITAAATNALRDIPGTAGMADVIASEATRNAQKEQS